MREHYTGYRHRMKMFFVEISSLLALCLYTGYTAYYRLYELIRTAGHTAQVTRFGHIEINESWIRQVRS